MKQAFFIAGTDTGAGKTHATCALLHAFRAHGLTALGMKPIAAGTEADGENEDVVRLRAASSFTAPAGQINPYCFPPPIAPHLAAREAGVAIDPGLLAEAFAALQKQADVVLVEGVGGFLVPLADDFDAADLASRLGLPVILIVGMRLGCLNHALLTQEAIRIRGLPLAGWIANRIDPDMNRFDENLQTLREKLRAPLLGVIDHGTDVVAAASCLTLPEAA